MNETLRVIGREEALEPQKNPLLNITEMYVKP